MENELQALETKVVGTAIETAIDVVKDTNISIKLDGVPAAIAVSVSAIMLGLTIISIVYITRGEETQEIKEKNGQVKQNDRDNAQKDDTSTYNPVTI